ncbi:UNVERIFIED_CONTAM: hypothetical protein FKN15_032098 [Acipenser sinensis]
MPPHARCFQNSCTPYPATLICDPSSIVATKQLNPTKILRQRKEQKKAGTLIL